MDPSTDFHTVSRLIEMKMVKYGDSGTDNPMLQKSVSYIENQAPEAQHVIYIDRWSFEREDTKLDELVVLSDRILDREELLPTSNTSQPARRCDYRIWIFLGIIALMIAIIGWFVLIVVFIRWLMGG